MRLSVIIPTYNEQDNVATMLARISAALLGVTDDYEIWFIDDSTDNTPQLLQMLAARDFHVHFVHRTGMTGLASAVVHGFKVSDGDCIIVLDGDLQHPPELIPVVYLRLCLGIDIVIPSRFITGGSDGGLSGFRKLVSFAARRIGQLALRKLRLITDCTSGFFGLQRSVIDNTHLDPIGWKILIEILAKGNYRTVHEVAYTFQARDAGLSKMTLREQWNYLRHIMRLVVHSDEDRRFLAFCSVGLSGVVINMAFLSLFIYWMHMSEVPSSVLASVVAMLNNFFWNDKVTWRSRDEHHHASAVRLPLFMLISAVGITITTLVMDSLHFAGVPVLVGQSAGIIVATYWSFIANNRWTWKQTINHGGASVENITVTQEKLGFQPESAS